MFNRTARENILYGNPDATEEQMFAAARAAEAHDFILSLRDHQGRSGYDAYLGERGVKLSGGQRQRIGLARAIYGDPALVVLDEPNANLDDVGEAALTQTVLELKAKGKTVFLITHRQGAIAAADHLMILQDGQLVANGPRDAVIAALQRAQQQAQAPQPVPQAQ